MRIKATKVTGADLKPGDLFSTATPEYWDNIDDNHSIGERVYIRTNEPADSADDAALPIYRITIERDEP